MKRRLLIGALLVIGLNAVSLRVMAQTPTPPAPAATLAATLAITPSATPTPLPSVPKVRYDFQFIRQGQVGLLEIDGAAIVSATAQAMGHSYPCYPDSTGAACLIAAPMDEAIKDYPISLTVTHSDGTTFPWSSTFTVASGQFIATPFTLPGNLQYLTRDDIQLNEDTRLLSAYSIITPTRYWTGPFTPPVNSRPISPFGEIRSYTGSAAVRRHTGQDLTAGIGTPVLASANGRVVLSRLMDIHGNNIVIDHGWGVYSEYVHLSERYVVPGQYVLQGDVIGLSGNTGRSTGPHVHWEIAVADIWVNPLQFATLKLPQ